jgi:hypothetical protein
VQRSGTSASHPEPTSGAANQSALRAVPAMCPAAWSRSLPCHLRGCRTGIRPSLAPIEYRRLGAVALRLLGRIGLYLMWQSLHQTINRTRAALPSVIGGPGSDFTADRRLGRPL